MLQAFYKPGILQKVIKNEEVYRISVYISIYRELELFQYKKVNNGKCCQNGERVIVKREVWEFVKKENCQRSNL